MKKNEPKYRHRGDGRDSNSRHRARLSTVRAPTGTCVVILGRHIGARLGEVVQSELRRKEPVSSGLAAPCTVLEIKDSVPWPSPPDLRCCTSASVPACMQNVIALQTKTPFRTRVEMCTQSSEHSFTHAFFTIFCISLALIFTYY